ncbi:helix-turn-helix domain-containing protein [Paenisporosarcina sp. TG20]|uniref:helix-turn-helix domain-containing protein n=1 Tax=Paenisporosarcina sp. TG20 TaxID=1211706 RepID=UPI00031EEE68|nr:helix-turn-helix domain-containing protein [Paenisporosarcina sp. TG20]
MLFQKIILHIIDTMNEERTISAPFHIIRGKRSGQTIQDVKSYGLTKYFSLFPRLSIQIYDQNIQQMIQSGWLTINDTAIPKITILGKQKLKDLPILKLNGWLFRGNERTFFQRLSLVTQTLSHVKAKSLSFTPVQKDEKIQIWVRQFLKSFPYKSDEFIQSYYLEIMSCLKSDNLSDLHVSILSHRLAGFEVSGVTWQQLSNVLNEEQIDLQIYFYEGLHILLDEISTNKSLVLLPKMSEGIKSTTPLTDSAKRTADLYKQGYSFEQLISMRQLKTSTIEDHFVEMALNDPSFSIQIFFGKEDLSILIQQIKNQRTKKLRTLKEIFPLYSYFQLRLLLAVGGAQIDSKSS